jgi:hypothetical protein
LKTRLVATLETKISMKPFQALLSISTCAATTWNDKRLSLLQMYKAHIGKLGESAASELTVEGVPGGGAMTRAHRLKLMQHVKLAQMIGFDTGASPEIKESAEDFSNQRIEQKGGESLTDMVARTLPEGRGLHSSTFQLNLSRC